MNFRPHVYGVIALLVIAGCDAETEDPPVRNIILMIADGAGVGAWGAAEVVGPLSVSSMPVAGLVATASATHKVTDSAAGATVYAIGERVTNRSIGVGPGCPFPSSADSLASEWPSGCEARDSWFSLAKDKGKATGVVTTTYVVDATPAAFFAHSPSRYWYEMMAEQAAEANLDVMLGGGRRFFEAATRHDGRDLMAGICQRSDCVSSAPDLARYNAGPAPLVGLFTPGDFDSPPSPRPVGLPEMVTAALSKLSQDPDGFVALFETEATDNDGHSNAPVERLAGDLREFDRAVGIVLEFARRTPGTLVIVTADHETGGFSLVESGTDFTPTYTTTLHTAAPVPLFAEGPRSEEFAGFHPNYEVGRKLLEIVNGW